MKQRAVREYTPVVYPESAVKVLYNKNIPPNGVAFSLHWHKRMEITRVVSGSLVYTADDNTFVLPAGSIAISNPYRPHGAFAGNEGANYYTVMFDVADFYNQSLASKRYLTAISEGLVQFFHFTDDAQILKVVDLIIDSDNDRSRSGAIGEMSGVYSLLALLYEKCLFSESPATMADIKFKEVFEYIEQHYTENLSSSLLSKKFGYNEAYFCRKFKEVAGINAMKYILVLKLEKSAKMLKDNKNIGEVVLECGFCNVSHFSNCFKRHFGISPSEYRKHIGE